MAVAQFYSGDIARDIAAAVSSAAEIASWLHFDDERRLQEPDSAAQLVDVLGGGGVESKQAPRVSSQAMSPRLSSQ